MGWCGCDNCFLDFSLNSSYSGKASRRLTFWTRFHPKARYSLTVVSRNRHKCEEKLNPPDENAAGSTVPGCLKCLISDEAQNEESADLLNVEGHSIVEEKNWRIAANVGAIAITCTTTFLFGFFA